MPADPWIRTLAALHLGALVVWLAAALRAALLRARARALGAGATALRAHRAAMRPLLVEHAAFAALLLSGALLLELHGWSLTRAGWLGVKAGLAALLLLPLEGMHAFVAATWIAPGLRESAPGAFARRLVRGLGVEEMIRTLELLLFTPAVPLLVWLSLRRPF